MLSLVLAAHRGEVQVVPPLLPPLPGAPGELEPAVELETNAIRRFRLVSIVSYSRPSLIAYDI